MHVTLIQRTVYGQQRVIAIDLLKASLIEELQLSLRQTYCQNEPMDEWRTDKDSKIFMQAKCVDRDHV